MIQGLEKDAIQLLEFAHACVRRWERMLGIDGGGECGLIKTSPMISRREKKDRHWLGCAIGLVELPYNDADESLLTLVAEAVEQNATLIERAWNEHFG
jgi:hypothetical protein